MLMHSYIAKLIYQSFHIFLINQIIIEEFDRNLSNLFKMYIINERPTE